MTRTCQRFSIPRTIEWIDGGNYIVSLKERDEESERSGASHGCGNKDTPQMETKASSMADTRESCTSIDGSHHDIDALHGNESERVKTNESRRRGRKSTSGLPHKRRSKAQTYQSCIGDDRNGQIRRRKSLQLVSRKACSEVQEFLKAEHNEILCEYSESKRQDETNYELKPHPTGNSDLPISMLASLLSLNLADAIERGLYSSDESIATD